MQYHVYGLGNALVDYEYQVSSSWLAAAGLSKGHMTLMSAAEQQRIISTIDSEPVTCASGGSGANSIIALAQLGGSAFYSCKVGDDLDGEFYCADMNAVGVDTNLAVGSLPSGDTGKCLVLVSEDAERTMCSYLGISSMLSERELDKEALCDSQYLYLEGYLVTSESARRAAISARQLARQNQVKVAMSLSDPNMVKFFKDGLLEMLGDGIDLLFANAEEAMGLTATSNIATAIDALKPLAQHIVITNGAEGAVIFDGSKNINISAAPSKCIDTLGAGDMFAGAYLYALSHNMGAARAGNLAALAAAKVVSQFGPRLEDREAKSILKSLDSL